MGISALQVVGFLRCRHKATMNLLPDFWVPGAAYVGASLEKDLIEDPEVGDGDPYACTNGGTDRQSN